MICARSANCKVSPVPSIQIVGHIFDELILLPFIDVGYPGLGSKYDTELFIRIPVLGKTTFEPNLFRSV